MRIYKEVKEALSEIERDLVELGTEVASATVQDKMVKCDPAYLTKELRGYSYLLTQTTDLDEVFNFFNIPRSYAEVELSDRVSPEYLNPGFSWLERPKIWEEFLHGGKFSYTYNERFREQLPIIIEELKRRPTSRQCIITMYDRHQDIAHLGGLARIPCSMYYQVFIREKKLEIIYTMRSCDFYTHFGYDLWLAIKLQRHLAKELDRPTGNFIHFIGSLHAFKRDYETKGVF